MHGTVRFPVLHMWPMVQAARDSEQASKQKARTYEELQAEQMEAEEVC